MPPILYIVIPCYNEEQVLPVTAPMFLQKITDLAAAGKISENSRILFVDDGSKDSTWEIICNLAKTDEHYIGIRQSRNRGHQNAVLAGLMEAKDRCDITISIDCDGQDDLDAMDAIAAEVLDDTFRTALTGESKEYRESSSSLLFAFGLAILLIYLILAAQFESFRDPMLIMFTVPLTLAGALIALKAFGQTLNIFSEIGIIMLVGLVAKNGILIVEFANQKQETGIDKMQAIREAAIQRLRPILMTTMTTVLGMIPMAVGNGVGSEMWNSMGMTEAWGLAFSTLITLFLIPVLFTWLALRQERKNAKKLAQLNS